MARLPIADNPAFNLVMEAMTKDTPGSYEEFNVRYIQILENLLFLERNKQDTIDNWYDGRELEMTFTQLKEKVNRGDFSGLHLYDYIDFTTTYGEDVRAEIMGFNTMLYMGDTMMARPHVLMQTRDCLFDTTTYNSTSTNSGGFNSSNMPSAMNGILAACPDDLKGAILKCRRLESTKSDRSWFDRMLFLPTETEVFGYPCLSELHCCTAGKQWEGYQKSFKHVVKGLGKEARDIGSRHAWWLSSPSASDTTNFCIVNGNGVAHYSDARISNGVAPAFLIG